jgi:membrane-associated protease RseP (regulator of RpoE activity)
VLHTGLVTNTPGGGVPCVDVLYVTKTGGRPSVMTLAAIQDTGVALGPSDGIAVTFSQSGSLGLKLSPNADAGTIEIIGINPGTQAEQHPLLRAGLVVVTIAGAPVEGKSYAEVLGMIKDGGRPLPMVFAPPPMKSPRTATTTFTQPGSLGMKLVAHKETGGMVLAGVNPGTQAEQHPQLRAGLVVTSVAGVSAVGKPYVNVLGMIKAGGRPLTMTFAAGTYSKASRTVQHVATRATPSVATATAFLSAVFHTPGPLGIVWTRFKDAPKNTLIPVVKGVKAGSAAAKAGVSPMATLVTVNGAAIRSWAWPVLIQQLKTARPLTLGLDTSQVVAPTRVSVTVIFAGPGPLGLALVPVKHGGPNDSRVLLKEVKPTSPVAGDKRLLPGMRLTSLQVGVDAAVSCMGMPYEEVLALIKRSGRPLQVSFRKFADTPAPAPASAQGGAKLPVQVATLQVSLAADNVRALQAQDEKELSSTPVAQPTPQQQAVVAEMQCAEEMQLLAPAAPQAEPETRPEPETHLGISSGESAHQMESDSAVDRLSDPGAKPQLVAQLELGSISSGSEEEANHDAEEALAMVGHMD